MTVLTCCYRYLQTFQTAIYNRRGYGWMLLTLRRKVHSDGWQRMKHWRTRTGVTGSPVMAKATRTVSSFYSTAFGMMSHVQTHLVQFVRLNTDNDGAEAHVTENVTVTVKVVDL